MPDIRYPNEMLPAGGHLTYAQLPTGGGIWANGGDLALTGGNLTLSGHLLFSPDGTYDIGGAGVSRPRNVQISGSLTIGGSVAISGSYVTNIVLSKSNPQFTISDTTTNPAKINWTSNGGTEAATAGIDRAAGGGLFVGSSPYSACFGSASARSAHIATNNTVRFTIDSAGAATFLGSLVITGNQGFYGGAATAKQTITGSRVANPALASLLTALAAIGLVTDSST